MAGEKKPYRKKGEMVRRPKDQASAIQRGEQLEKIISMRINGYTHAQIAREVGVTVGNVTTRLREAADEHWEQIPKQVEHLLSQELMKLDSWERKLAEDVQAIKDDNADRLPDRDGNFIPARLHNIVIASAIVIHDRRMRLLGLDRKESPVNVLIQNNAVAGSVVESPIIQLYIPHNNRDHGDAILEELEDE